MLNPTSIQSQYERAKGDDLRVLIVGAGIAGVTAAQMLRRDGRHPVLVERAEAENVHSGGQIGPIGSALEIRRLWLG
jgi:2-polyprenyl-6-methoxyphenol hydroxylase-like FAD-dependent oxidoreductase